jgi:hypothetical protein
MNDQHTDLKVRDYVLELASRVRTRARSEISRQTGVGCVLFDS